MSRMRDERGAEAIEFALAAPILLLLVFGLLYALLATAANLSLSHAAGHAVRYASIPHDPVAGGYPTPDEVEAELTSRTPFFDTEDCTTAVIGDGAQNAPVALDVDCTFPNPAGAAVSGLRHLLGGGADHYASDLVLSASARARRE